MTSRIGSIIFGGVFAAIGGTLFYLVSYPVITQSTASNSWPVTTATVRESYVEIYDGLYKLQFIVDYVVNEEKFTTNRYLSDEASTSWKGGKYDFAAAHPSGSTIDVYYNPKKPHEATTLPGFQSSYLFIIGISCIFFFAGIFFMLAGIKRP